ncbi:MAG: exopolysaccharide biosynthesis protein [Deltaproteobacteria bacterium]|nr:MAG: exopolysaccharide biosynthesis protein [Deltaproteobacteria bacterium]
MSKLKKALDKARETRQQEFSPAAAVNTDESSADNNEHFNQQHKVDPSQAQTRISACDLRQLRNNKIIFDCQSLAAADQVKILRTQILDNFKEIQGNSLLLTSPTAGTGTTLTAINLALSMAQEINRTVLLVDADLRHPSVHNYFGLTAERGLSDYLLGKADLPKLLINPGFDKLTILPGGEPLPNSTELLGAPRMESLVSEMKTRYADRFLIFDSSPLLSCADALVFSNFIDSVLLVVEAEKNSRREIKQAMELLQDKPVLGSILNKVRN